MRWQVGAGGRRGHGEAAEALRGAADCALAALVAGTQACPRVDSHSATVTRGQSRFCSVIFKVNI